MHYHAGHNMPGYMPMEDDPTIYTTFDEAKASVIGDLDRAGDHIFDGGETEDERAIADEYSAAMEDLNLSSGPDWGTTLPTSTSEHDLGEHYWITSCSEDCTDDDENKCECEGPLHNTTCWWVVNNDDGRDQATGDPAIDYPKEDLA